MVRSGRKVLPLLLSLSLLLATTLPAFCAGLCGAKLCCPKEEKVTCCPLEEQPDCDQCSRQARITGEKGPQHAPYLPALDFAFAILPTIPVLPVLDAPLPVIRLAADSLPLGGRDPTPTDLPRPPPCV